MKEAYTTTASMILGEDGILRVKLKKGARIKVADLENHFRVTERLLEGRKALVLVDARTDYFISPAARAFSSKASAATRIATAFVTRSKAGMHFINLYIRINKPSTPTRFFTDIKEAETWLLSFREK